MKPVSVVVVGHDPVRRDAITEALGRQQAAIVGECTYSNLERMVKGSGLDCDAVMIDLDSDPDAAIDLVESVCSRTTAVTVMMYSRAAQSDLLVRCMRAGAREFLVEPVSQDVLAEALIRAAARRQEFDRERRSTGQLLVFSAAKGGVGVTTLASNFAVSLAQESGKKVVLVDLNLQLGDAALALGIRPKFSVRDALGNAGRLDSEFVSGLLETHSSGLSVLSGPEELAASKLVPAPETGDVALEKLMRILQDQFAYVVVDAGLAASSGVLSLASSADVVYVVTQVNVPCLRNSQRLISHLHSVMPDARRLEVIVNRYESRKAEITLDHIEKVLSTAVKWRVPNDYVAVHRAQNEGTALASGSSAIPKVLQQMAKMACGKPEESPKKRFSLFGI
jgi:pilus assembly protein CpaE